MTAGLELPLPEQTAATVQVPEDQEQVLSSLAKIKERQLVCFPTAQELETQEEVHEMISPLLAAYKKLMQDRESYLAKLNLPHAASFSNSEPGSEPEIIPKKKIIQSHLKKLGYKHYGPGGGQGLMCFRKCTSNNNIISIHFDFGTWSKSLHAALHFRGPLTEFSINLLYSNDEKRLLGISSATVFGQAIENLSKVIEAVEKDLITEIEKQLPATPVWYASVV